MYDIKPFLESCRVSVSEARLTHCWPGWGESDYVPDYNKFYFILSGEGELTVDGVSCRPRPGDLFLMPARRFTDQHYVWVQRSLPRGKTRQMTASSPFPNLFQ